MAKYLIDVNLPRYFSLWQDDAYEHVIDINDELPDSEIWRYAKKHELTIVTKDADFSERMLLNQPPPRVIHIKSGNMSMRDFHEHVSNIWPDVCLLSQEYKLVRVFQDRIECVD